MDILEPPWGPERVLPGPWTLHISTPGEHLPTTYFLHWGYGVVKSLMYDELLCISTQRLTIPIRSSFSIQKHIFKYRKSKALIYCFNPYTTIKSHTFCKSACLKKNLFLVTVGPKSFLRFYRLAIKKWTIFLGHAIDE